MAGRNDAGAAPWGWWLRAQGGVIVDPEGREWASVRDAFWQGRLGFPATHVAPEQHELLLRVLLSIERPYGDTTERVHDIFSGDMMFWRFHHCWLVSVGLVDRMPGLLGFNSALTAEGRSVLAMLLATRDPGHAVLSLSAVLEAMRAAGRTAADGAREDALRSIERGVVRMLYLFAREELAGRPVVTLTGMAGGRMPMRRVMWSQSFTDPDVRDNFFAWLTQRVDRWEDWGAMAYSKGADALTTHLLGLFAARLPDG